MPGACGLRGAEGAQKKCNYEYQPDFDQICFMGLVEMGHRGHLDICALSLMMSTVGQILMYSTPWSPRGLTKFALLSSIY